MLFSRVGGASVRLSWTRGGAFVDEGSGSELERGAGPGVVLSSLGGTASTKAMEAESSRM